MTVCDGYITRSLARVGGGGWAVGWKALGFCSASSHPTADRLLLAKPTWASGRTETARQLPRTECPFSGVEQ